MSDERAADSDGNGDTESGDDLDPGGGPQRVVSEESVDDILASLDETKSKAADADDTTADSEGIETTFDEDDGPAADAPTQPDTESASETATADRPKTGDSDAATADTDAPTVDAAASSLPDDASLEDLAARVEDGSVTGADVRAAEAGDGRESTPSIDEVDLSVDDLEPSGTGERDRGLPDDAGPLAGSVDRDPAPEASDDDSDENPGLLGRLKNLFSR